MEKIREPAVSGLFYPGSKVKLEKMIAQMIENAKVEAEPGKEIWGLISPHAGYIYSGQCAAYAYKLILNRNYDTVIILAPSHYVYLEGASVWDTGFYKTPLGKIEVDNEFTSAILKASSKIKFYEPAHLQEHSLEVQLPFLQYCLKNFKLVPIIIGNPEKSFTSHLAEVLFNTINEINRNYLIVCSTDLSHYHSYEVAQRMDKLVAERLKEMDIEGLYELVLSGRGEACGIGPVLTTLYLAKKFNLSNIEILNMTNSGEVTGDRSRVVGYLSGVIYK